MKYITYILFLFLLTSCLGTKKVTEINNTKKIEVKKDSSKIVEKNKSISDKLDLSVVSAKTKDKEFNKKVDAKVDEILSKLNTSKKSGDNSYKLYYNLLKRQVEFEAKIGETNSEKTNVSTEKTTEEVIDTYISKKVTALPWWVWVIAIIYFLPNILNAVSLIINPFKALLRK